LDIFNFDISGKSQLISNEILPLVLCTALLSYTVNKRQ